MHDVSWFMIVIGMAACSVGVLVMFCRAAAADRKGDAWDWLPLPISFPAVMLKILCQREAIRLYRYELLSIALGLVLVILGLRLMP